MSVFTGLFSRISGSVVGTFFGSYKNWIIGGLVAVLMGGIGFYVYGAEKAKGQRDTLQAKLESVAGDFEALNVAIDLNHKALKTCLIVNKQNDIDLRNQERRVQETEKIVMLLQAESKHTVEDIRNDGEKLRGKDTVCRTVDESLPDWFTVGLWE